MTAPTDSSASRGSLRDEAANWFALMRGPDADERRGEFEEWLTGSALHREAYNRIAETFSIGKLLKQAPTPEPQGNVLSPRSPIATRRITVIATFVALAIATAAGVIWFRSELPTPARSLRSAQAPGQDFKPRHGELRLETRLGEIREVRLGDGSTATLDTNSALLVSMTGGERVLTLIKGRARFAVVHDGRRFLVHAGTGTVTAVGTLFDVGLLAGGRVNVRLLSGAIDVAMRPTAQAQQVRRLAAGDAISYGSATGGEIVHAKTVPDADWPAGLRVFDGARLADVVADANRYTGVPIRLAGADVGDLKISGTFRIDDSTRLAANISDVLGLAQVVSSDQIELVRGCPVPAQKNCRPPS